MKKLIFLLFFVLLIPPITLLAEGLEGQPFILIAYFTRAQNMSLIGKVDAISGASLLIRNGRYMGNTELIADWIHQEVGGDLFSIRTVNQYSSDYDETVRQGEYENRINARPQLATRISRMADYNFVFLGFPNWAYDMPMVIYTFLETYDLSGKTIIPFNTHGGSGFSDALRIIRSLEPGAIVLEGLSIFDSRTLQSRQSVNNWLGRLGF